MKKLITLCAALAAMFLAGCQKEEGPKVAGPVTHKHEHKPLHGGTPVELGHEEYHVELVIDPAEGKLRAYVMDGELENFVRIAAESFEIDARLAEGTQPLVFKAIANNATGEKVGDSSLYEAQADWLKKTNVFDATLKEIVVRGTAYRDVNFNFPKGNDQDETTAK